MATSQVEFRGRGDSVGLNANTFAFGPDTYWTQDATNPFRVRFAVSGTGTIPGQLEFSTDGSAWANVTDTSGTVQAAVSAHFAEGDATTYLLTDSQDFVAGYADCRDGLAGTVTLAAQHTEFEYCVRLVGQDVTAAGTVHLRIDGVDTYARTAQVYVGLTARDRVRLKVGDTDSTAYKLTNAQVDAFVAAWPTNVEMAAADAADAIAAAYADGYNFASDGQSFNRRERFQHYHALAQRLRSRAGPYAWPPVG